MRVTLDMCQSNSYINKNILDLSLKHIRLLDSLVV